MVIDRFNENLQEEIRYRIDSYEEDRDWYEASMTVLQACNEYLDWMEEYSFAELSKGVKRDQREIRKWFIELGIYKAYSNRALSKIMVTSGKKYDFIMDGNKYRFETWDVKV
jgi:hypothetical protein